MAATKKLSNQAPKSLRQILNERLLLTTQADLAELLGVSQNWISNHTKTGSSAGVQTKKRKAIAKALGIDPLEFAFICKQRPTESSK